MLPPGVLGGSANPGMSPEEMQQLQQMKYVRRPSTVMAVPPA